MFQRPVENFHRVFLWNGLGIKDKKCFVIPKSQRWFGYKQ